jgi:WD40 repeat protein
MGAGAVNALAFSPDGTLLALACGDGRLRVMRWRDSELVRFVWTCTAAARICCLGKMPLTRLPRRVSQVVSFRSYYGGFLCVTWSSDGRYILAGGEDDRVSLFAFNERALVCAVVLPLRHLVPQAHVTCAHACGSALSTSVFGLKDTVPCRLLFGCLAHLGQPPSPSAFCLDYS